MDVPAESTTKAKYFGLLTTQSENSRSGSVDCSRSTPAIALQMKRHRDCIGWVLESINKQQRSQKYAAPSGTNGSLFVGNHFKIILEILHSPFWIEIEIHATVRNPTISIVAKLSRCRPHS